MKQTSLDLNLSSRMARKQVFLAQMQRVVPWAALVELIAQHYPEGKNGRPPFALETMPRLHFMQQWHGLSDLAIEDAFFDTPLFRVFAQLDAYGRLPDESTILRFRHRLEKHKLADQILATAGDLLTEQGLLLKAGTTVDASLIASPSSTKNKVKARDREMHSSQKGRQLYFGMKAHIGVDAHSGLVHTVRGTSGHVADVAEGNSLLHGEEAEVLGDAGYQGADKRPDAKKDVTWHVAMRLGKRKALDKDNNPADALIDRLEKIKAAIRAKVEHAFGVAKRQFDFMKVQSGFFVSNHHGKGGIGPWHVQSANRYDSSLKSWMTRFRGVATKYLANYLGWRRLLDHFKDNFTPQQFLFHALRTTYQ